MKNLLIFTSRFTLGFIAAIKKKDISEFFKTIFSKKKEDEDSFKFGRKYSTISSEEIEYDDNKKIKNRKKKK